MNGVAKEEIAKRVAIAAKTLKMEALLDRKPKDMSGGQRQRVAIGRAIVRDPKVFLFDEPLSNLDAELRVEMRLQIAKLHHELGNTMIYVTHDQVEAMTLADKIVVLRSGNVEQVGSPLELYHAPANEFVAGFIGSPKMNFVDALLDDLHGDQASVRLPDGQIIALSVNADLVSQGEKVRLGIRPEHIHTQANQGDFSVSFQSEVVERLGNSTYLFGNYCGKDGFKVHIQGDKSVGLYEYISLGICLSDCHLFNAEGIAVGKREIPADSKH
jgi:multiple sugar transport system ATP-binding protein